MKLDHIKTSSFQQVKDISIPDIYFNRMKTGIAEFDELFGEGVLPGAAFTFTGDPGCGKTTLLLQYMEALASNGYNVGYASGEEANYQLAYNCRRLGIEEVAIANITDVDTICEEMKHYDVMVVDSWQALTGKESVKGLRAFEKYCVTNLITAAKKHECAVIFVMHLTKGGQFKGSTEVTHSVDVNFKISMDPDGEETDRIITVYKNRFGSTGAYGASMGHKGFTLSGKVEVSRSKSKSARKEELRKQILELDPPNITKDLIMEKFNLTQAQAYTTLRELVDDKSLVKMGRGKSAVWKKTEKVLRVNS